jgi:hypothetical protein
VRLDREQVIHGIPVHADIDGDHAKGLHDRETVRVFVESVHLARAPELGETLDREPDGTAAPNAHDVVFTDFGELAAVPGGGRHVGEAE